MSTPLRSCLALALLGCGSPPAPAAPVSTLVSPPVSVLPVIPAAPMHNAHVDPAGCTFTGISEERLWVSTDSAKTAASFAVIQTPSPVQLVLGAAAGDPNGVQLDLFGLTFDAQVPEDGASLHAHAPLGLAGVYDPAAEIRIHWHLSPRGSETPGFEASTSAADRMDAVSKRVGCAEVGLDIRTLAQRPLPKRTGYGRANVQLALAPDADAAPTAQIPAGEVVQTYGRKNGRTEISFVRNGLWHGWVPSSSLDKSTAAPGVGFGTGRGILTRVRFPGFACPVALFLYVRAKDEQGAPVRVGRVRADAHVGLEPAGDDAYRALSREQRATSDEQGKLSLQGAYELVVERAASAACTPHTAP